MTGRERILAALQGRPKDRIPWAPMMVKDYLTGLPGFPAGGGRTVELDQVRFVVDFYREIGADVITYNRPGFYRRRSASGRVSQRTWPEGGQSLTEITTPVGSLTWKRAIAGLYSYVMEPLLKTPRDFRTYAYMVEDMAVEPDFTMSAAYLGIIGDAGIPFPISPSPAIKQFLMRRAMDLEDMIYCLNDANADLIRLFDVVHRHNVDVFKIAAQSPLPVFQDGGATSTGVMSPELYERYCAPYVHEYCDILHSAGKLKLDHSVGEPIAGILQPIVDSGVDGIFGYRPTCERNPTVAEIRAAWKGGVCLMGGIDTDYLARYTAEQTAREAEAYIRQLKPDDRTILATSSAAVPGTPLENFRVVSQVLSRAFP